VTSSAYIGLHIHVFASLGKDLKTLEYSTDATVTSPGNTQSSTGIGTHNHLWELGIDTIEIHGSTLGLFLTLMIQFS